MINMELFPKRLKGSREKKGYTQKQLAKMTGLTPASLSAYEKEGGEGSKTPLLNTAVRLAEKLEVSLDWLCGGDEEQKDIISNYGDICNLLVEISKRIDFEIGFREMELDNEEILCPTITLLDKELPYLFSQWKKVKLLFDNGTIDIDIYEQWLDKWKKSFDFIPIEVSKKFKRISLEDFEAFLEASEEDEEIKE